MQVVRDVTVDLWNFLRTEVGARPQSQSESLSPPVVPSPAGYARELLTVADLVESPVEPVAVPNNLPVATAAAEVPATQPHAAVHGQMYVAYPDTPCHLRPAMVRDTLIGMLAYGDAVQVLSQRDDWVRISASAVEGWVERFALTPHLDDIFPTFAVGEEYDAEHPETIKLRTYINDEFGSRLVRAPLLNSEYVWYQLCRANAAFSWPPIRPRTPGRWREILRTEPTVHAGTVPLTGGVMEYTDAAGIGHVYMVDAVTPEESVHVSGFTGADDGVFVRPTFSAAEVAALNASFLCKI